VQIERKIFKMHEILKRDIEQSIIQNLRVFPAVALLGPRQCGKSTLAKMLSKQLSSFVYLDLQNTSDLSRLTDPILFFKANPEGTICIDEIQLMPELFTVLRSIIDENRRNGRFILLGSASRELISQTAESLAGRIGLIELSPFLITEIQASDDFQLSTFWLRGGYPESYLSQSDDDSKLWRENFIRTYIERDIPQLGFQIPALQLRRLLSMLAHNQGQLLNSSKLGESMGLTHPTIRRYIDLLEQTFIIRTLQPLEANVKKRLVKSPKVYIRDSGLLHRLLQIDTFNDLIGNPVFGSSWEGIVIENIISHFKEWNFTFYRIASGEELDLIMVKGTQIIAVECKASTAPSLTKGFWKALENIRPDKTFIVAPISTSYPIKENVTVCGLLEFLKLVEN
jgi:hypothetical protein